MVHHDSSPALHTSPVSFPHVSLEYWRSKNPEKSALIFDNRGISYQTLWERVSALARGLHLHGIRKGERVVLISTNHPCFLETYFACSLLGAILVPINFRLAPPELLFQVRDADPSLVIFGSGQHQMGDVLRTRLPLPGKRVFFVEHSPPWARPFEELISTGTSPEMTSFLPVLDPEDPQMIMYTSGTTGIPKGALLPYRKTYYNNLNAQLFFELTPDDSVLVPVPLFHSLGLNILSIPVLFCGGTVLLMEKFDERATFEAIERFHITFMGAVPTIYRRLAKFGFDHFDRRSLRFCFTAGAPISVSLIEQYHQSGILMKQGFGQTETSILCCLDASDAVRKAGTVGKPVRHAQVRIVDNALHDVPHGHVGEIVAKGPVVMLGYWKRPEETARALKNGWLHTQDLAMADDEGFITLAGRKNDMYISGGENIYPEEIEKVYAAHPLIEDIAVVGTPDPDLGESGCAFIVPRSGALLNEEELKEFARGRIAGYKIPRRFLFLHSLPKTETGKVQKYLLARSPHLHPNRT